MPEASSMTDLFSMTDDLPSMTEASSMTDAQNTGREPTMSRTARRVLMAGIIAAAGGAATAAPAVAGVNISPNHVDQIRSWGGYFYYCFPTYFGYFCF
jgi:hypothetical protein